MNVEKKYLKRGLEHISPLFRQEQPLASSTQSPVSQKLEILCVGGLQLGKASQLDWLKKMQQCLTKLHKEFVCFQAQSHKNSSHGSQKGRSFFAGMNFIPIFSSGQNRAFSDATKKTRTFLFDFSNCDARDLDRMLSFLDHLVLYIKPDLDGQTEVFRFLKWVASKKSSLIPVHILFTSTTSEDRNEFYFEQFAKLAAEKIGIFIEYAGTLIEGDDVSLDEFLAWQKFFDQKPMTEVTPFRSQISGWVDAQLLSKGNSYESNISNLLH